MFQNKFLLFGSALLLLASQALAGMECNIGGIRTTCPAVGFSEDDAFCCTRTFNAILDVDVSYCCNFGTYANQNPGIIAGIVIGVLILVLLPVCCCLCCFCACCPIYQRRVQRGAVIYRH